CKQVLVERAPVDPDANGLVVRDRDVDYRLEVLVVPLPWSNVAGVYPVLVERTRRLRVVDEQLVTVEVEVAHQGHVRSHVEEPRAYLRHGACCGVVVDRYAHDLAAGAPQLVDLLRGAGGVRGVGVRHALHHDRVAAAYRHAAYPGRR